jgi:sirohydrochlorin cobaltochelatase
MTIAPTASVATSAEAPFSSDDFDAQARRSKAETAKPMSSAPMKYNPDGSVDWANMWDSFCVLASAGGPPHRGTMLRPGDNVDASDPTYQQAQAEIIRGIYLVSGLRAWPGDPGWVAVECPMDGMAEWIAEQGVQENVLLRAEGNRFFAPCGVNWATKGEIKNVITVVAKTAHYWADHVPADARTALAVEEGLSRLGASLKRLFGQK